MLLFSVLLYPFNNFNYHLSLYEAVKNPTKKLKPKMQDVKTKIKTKPPRQKQKRKQKRWEHN